MSTLSDDSIQSIFDLVHELRTLVVRLEGVGTQPGLLELTESLASKIGAAGNSVGLYADRLADAAQLHEQLKALPRQLLRPEESQAFRESLERALLSDTTRILRVAYEAAMKSGCLEAVENALTEMQKRIDISSLERCQATEDRSKALQAELERTVKELAATRERVKWSLAKFATGAILGAVLSILYLAPQIEDFLASEIIYRPIHERR
ncbi:hypothetical protein ACM7OS_22525 [Pseudomonas aeruginosa]